MKTLYLFKLFCFSAAGLSFYHLYTELTRNHVDTFQVMTLTGLVVLLVELFALLLRSFQCLLTLK